MGLVSGHLYLLTPLTNHILLSQHNDLVLSLKTKFRIGLVVALHSDGAVLAGSESKLGAQQSPPLSV